MKIEPVAFGSFNAMNGRPSEMLLYQGLHSGGKSDPFGLDEAMRALSRAASMTAAEMAKLGGQMIKGIALGINIDVDMSRINEGLRRYKAAKRQRRQERLFASILAGGSLLSFLVIFCLPQAQMASGGSEHQHINALLILAHLVFYNVIVWRVPDAK